jgi:hypothetical protein
MRKKGIEFFMSKQHYHQQSYMEPLLIVHQPWFIGTTAVDIEISTVVLPTKSC